MAGEYVPDRMLRALSPAQVGRKAAPAVGRAIRSAFPVAGLLLFLLRNLPGIISIIVSVLSLMSREDDEVAVTMAALGVTPEDQIDPAVLATYYRDRPFSR